MTMLRSRGVLGRHRVCSNWQQIQSWGQLRDTALSVKPSRSLVPVHKRLFF